MSKFDSSRRLHRLDPGQRSNDMVVWGSIGKWRSLAEITSLPFEAFLMDVGQILAICICLAVLGNKSLNINACQQSAEHTYDLTNQAQR